MAEKDAHRWPELHLERKIGISKSHAQRLGNQVEPRYVLRGMHCTASN